MREMYDYLVKLRDEAECRDVTVALDTNLDAIFLTLRFADGSRRFTFAGREILDTEEDVMLIAAQDVFDERGVREGL